jgi:hypothetical protein
MRWAVLLCLPACQAVAGVNDFEIVDPPATSGSGAAGGGGSGGGQAGGGMGSGGSGACAPWAARYGDGQEQLVLDIAATGCDVVAVGTNAGSVDFGGGAIQTAESRDAFVTRLGPEGGYRWALGIAGADEQIGRSLALAPNGDVLVTGHFRGTASIGGDTYMANGRDAFLWRLDGDGNDVWHARYGGIGEQRPIGVAVADDGRVALVGTFQPAADFGGGPLPFAGGGMMMGDIFVAVFDPQGGHLFSHAYGDLGSDQAFAAAFDADGDLWVTGWFSGVVDFGGGPLTSGGATDAFVLELSPAGTHLFSARYGDGADQGMRSIAIDSGGNVVLGGTLLGSADFGGGAVTSAGGPDIVLVELDPSGAHRWSKRFGDGGPQCDPLSPDCEVAVAMAPGDEVLLAGGVRGGVDFGGGMLFASGIGDAYLARFGADGSYIAGSIFGDGDNQSARGVAADPGGNAILGGGMLGTLDLGSATLTSAGGADAFIALLAR